MIEFPEHFTSEELQISFHLADIDFDFSQDQRIISWLTQIIEDQSIQVRALRYIFCSDDYLAKLNVQYLDHDTLTDIITFPLSVDPIESELYISVDRVVDNAKDLDVSFDTELARVIVHGLLHLIGYKDKSLYPIRCNRPCLLYTSDAADD